MTSPPSSVCKVWNSVNESQFHENLILLEVLKRSQQDPWKSQGSATDLLGTEDFCDDPLNWVKPFLDDFALVAAQEGGASNVAAACLEENLDGLPEVTIKVAKNELFKEKQLECLHGIVDLMNAVRDGDMQRSTAETECFRLIASSCMKRMAHHVRGPKGLQQLLLPEIGLDIERFTESQNASTTPAGDSCLAIASQKYCQIIELVQRACSADHDRIKQTAITAYEVRRDISFRDLLSKLYPQKHSHVVKIVEKIGKIARFYRSAITFVRAAEVSGWKFKISTVPSYSRMVHALSSRSAPALKSRLPKSKGFTREQLKEIQRLLGRWRHYIIHAEMLLLIYFEQNPLLRTVKNYVGISKRCCFLCAKFIALHGRFKIEGTHQQLYSLWTLPSQLEFPGADESQKFCDTLKRLNGVVCEQIKQINRRHYAHIPFNAESVANFSRASIFAPLRQSTIASKLSLLSPASSKVDEKVKSLGPSSLLNEKDGQDCDSSRSLLVEEVMETNEFALTLLEAQNSKDQEGRSFSISERIISGLAEQSCEDVSEEVIRATHSNQNSNPSLDHPASNARPEISSGRQMEIDSRIEGLQEDGEEILLLGPNEEKEKGDTFSVRERVPETRPLEPEELLKIRCLTRLPLQDFRIHYETKQILLDASQRLEKHAVVLKRMIPPEIVRVFKGQQSAHVVAGTCLSQQRQER